MYAWIVRSFGRIRRARAWEESSDSKADGEPLPFSSDSTIYGIVDTPEMRDVTNGAL